MQCDTYTVHIDNNNNMGTSNIHSPTHSYIPSMAVMITRHTNNKDNSMLNKNPYM